MRTLVVYYSRTGNTHRLAEEIASHFKADLDPIRDEGVDRSGWWGYLLSGWQALSGATPPIHRAAKDPADYDLVVIGSPVWNWSLAAPVRTYARRHARQFRQVAFFCTEGGSGERRVFEELERLCGKPPRASIAVRERDLALPQHAARVGRYIAQLNA